MQVKQVYPSVVEVSLTSDECAVLAQVCELALEEHFVGREEERTLRYVETVGAAFKVAAVAGLARACAEPDGGRLAAALAEVGL